MRKPPVRRFGFRKTAVGLRPLCGFAPPHFFAPVKMLRIFLYRAQKNVAYNQNVMHNMPLTLFKRYGINSYGNI
jgi:hypothetical protein